MAGDINVGEMLLSTSFPRGAAPPPILHEYGQRIRIALGGEASRGEAQIAAAPIDVEALGLTERFGYDAFAMRNTPAYASSKSARPHSGASWGRAAETAPADSFPENSTVGNSFGSGPVRASSPSDFSPGSNYAADAVIAAQVGGHVSNFAVRSMGLFSIIKAVFRVLGTLRMPHRREDGPPPATGTTTPGTSDRLTGRVAVGLVLVSGSAPGLGMDRDEQTQIVADVQNALSWLGAQSPAKDVTWVHDIQAVTVDVPDTQNGSTFEDFEAPWRDAALRALNVTPGRAGVRQYVAALRSNRNARWSFCAFFTKYRLHHFAYANIGGPQLVMNLDCDGWKKENLDRVFAHEVAHIFGAPDEYALSGCNCTSKHGPYSRANLNCEVMRNQGCPLHNA